MRTVLILAIAAVVGVLAVSQWSYLRDLTQKQRIIATASFPIVGEPAPAFDLPSLDGAGLRLSDFEGGPVIVYFWTTWCSVCKKEMPLLVDYVETDAAPVPLVSICSGRT
jgi:thiol-disulfide isomerase/thioredoxin